MKAMKVKGYYRGATSPVPIMDSGVSLQQIKEWRETEYRAGRPNTLPDFYLAHGLCFDCGGIGVLQAGWSEPRGDIEIARAAELSIAELPYYAPCLHCAGTGLTRPKPRNTTAPPL